MGKDEKPLAISGGITVSLAIIGTGFKLGFPDMIVSFGWALALMGLGAASLILTLYFAYVWFFGGNPPEEAAYLEERARQRAKLDVKRERTMERVQAWLPPKTVADHVVAAKERSNEDAIERRLSVETWVPLSHALQYLIGESAWARSLTLGPRADPEDIIRREFFDAAARGDLEPWAVEVLDRQSTPWKLAASRATIPVEFWKYAWMQPFAEIWQNDAKRAMVCTDGYLPAPRKQSFLETSIRRSELESTWPKAQPAIGGATSPLETAFESWVRSSLNDPDWELDDESELLSHGAPPSAPGRPKPAAVDREKQARRRQLIDESRKLVASYDGDIGQDTQRQALESLPAYLALRKHLSQRFLDFTVHHAIHIDSKHPGPLMMRAFASELDRLETEWGLDD